MFINKQKGRVKRSTDESGLTITCQLFDMSDGKKMMSDGHIMLLDFFLICKFPKQKKKV